MVEEHFFLSFLTKLNFGDLCMKEANNQFTHLEKLILFFNYIFLFSLASIKVLASIHKQNFVIGEWRDTFFLLNDFSSISKF